MTLSGRQWSRSNVFVVAIVLMVIAVIADGLRQSHTKAISNPNDFVTLYAGSICMTHECNPYSVPQLDSVLVARRGTAVRQVWFDQLPIYPPTTLVLLLPFSFLSYRVATLVWYALSLGVYVFGLCSVCFRSTSLRGTPLIARAAFVLLGLHFPKMLQCLGFGNPSVMVTGLLLFAVFEDPGRFKTLSVIAALAACFLKPPMAIPVAAVMVVRLANSWRQALKIAAVYVGAFLLVAGCSYIPMAMAHWPLDLRGNITLGQHSGMNPSNRVSPSNVLLNVANIPGYFTTSSVAIQTITIGVITPLVALFLIALYRAKQRGLSVERIYLTAVATAAALTLLPVYHRFCDIGILLLAVPWLIRELFHDRDWQAIVALPVLCLLYFSWERRIRLESYHGQALRIVQFLYYRGDAVLVLLLACVLLSAFYEQVNGKAMAG